MFAMWVNFDVLVPIGGGGNAGMCSVEEAIRLPWNSQNPSR